MVRNTADDDENVKELEEVEAGVEDGDEGEAEVDQPSAGGSILSMSSEELKKALEAVLFTAGEPISIRTVADLFSVSSHDVRQAVEELRSEYVDTGRAFRLEDIAGGIQLLTLPAHDIWIQGLHRKQIQSKLSGAAFETLAVIAYKQPITRADLEAIRGVQCGQVIKNLLDRGLAKVVGRDENLGRPLLYGTTSRFLESFGIASVRDLPQPELLPRERSEPESKPD